jgi:hypothetical protein
MNKNPVEDAQRIIYKSSSSVKKSRPAGKPTQKSKPAAKPPMNTVPAGTPPLKSLPATAVVKKAKEVRREN